MNHARIAAIVLAAMVAGSTSAAAQGGLGKITQGLKQSPEQLIKTAKDVANAVVFTEEEEQQLGADVSAKLREKYGVVQDAAVHKYVALAGTSLAENSTRPKLRWTFIVLDTDGVNAFAAPGGYIHVTRGALALIKNEAELASVLGHEIAHVTLKHTINALKKTNWVSPVATATRTEFLSQVVNKVYSMTLENQFDQKDEKASDEVGITLANKAAYSPAGLIAFLNNLSERNKGLKEPSGAFASHPALKTRIADMTKTIGNRLTSVALVQPRYAKTINYRLMPITDIPQVAPPAAATTAKKEPEKTGGKGTFGLKDLNPLGKEKGSDSTTASAGSRGVNPDRDAKGGPNKALVVVTVTAAEVAAFKKGIL